LVKEAITVTNINTNSNN